VLDVDGWSGVEVPVVETAFFIVVLIVKIIYIYFLINLNKEN
jgi:hypothetical protein